jgi:hypothetical protein
MFRVLQALLFFATANAHAQSPSFTQSKVSDVASGLEATVFTFSQKQNHNFGILDLPDPTTAGTIKRHFDPAQHQLIINGGYFNPDWSPTGYCKIRGKTINPKINKRLSGFIAIDERGRITLLARGDDLSKFPTVLQSGPYVIDPGGKIGIRSKTGRAAKRTLIGVTKDKDLVIIITRPIYLLDLAEHIQKHIPDLERLLNLDGGPSTGFVTRDESLSNLTAVRNYVFLGIAK